eukprot:TRINITY_DN12621_c0_g1_i1.p1 TRINITY_DN12621_c0_g1~~TRINITY_DN12621_c0_g1_i1.p1  ORF type:complete len:669 (+),score=241.09 TRINITY_DN12621_c0_g1_i1:224-2008(+)
MVVSRGCPDGEGSDSKQAVFGNSEENVVATNDGKSRKKDFPFDYVFTNDQFEIYDSIGKDMLSEAFAGYNVCLFAYGQTGSGKTYTVQGLPGAGISSDVPHNPDNEGILPRLTRDLFNIVEEMLDDDFSLNIKVTMSLVEVYNEKVRDLLPQTPVPRGQEPPNLEIVQQGRRIDVVGLSHHTVIGYERVRQLLLQANKNRQVAETKMNECSSRSHTITQLHVVQRHENPTPESRDMESFITIVDLAGSERQSKTDAQGKEFQQAKYINHSLLQLGRAISSFSGGNKGQQYVPLRDSKLTRLLAESFGGNSKTWMLATAAPSLFNFSESLSTLNYASNAKNITNNAQQNRLERQLEMKELKERNAQLEESLDAMRRKTEQLQRKLASLEGECDELRKTGDDTQLLSLREKLTNDLQQLTTEDPQTARDKEFSSIGMMPDPAPPLSKSKTYIGRAKVSLKNIIEQSSQFFNLPLTNESGVTSGDDAFLKVKIYPVDAKGTPVTSNPVNSEKGLLGQRVDFVVHIISAANIPLDFSNTVYCKYVYKWAEKDAYKTNDANGTDPMFDFRKRFAFSKMNVGLVEYFRSDNVITFEVIGV